MPSTANWAESNGFILHCLCDARNSADPQATVLDFLESAYQAGAKTAGWDVAEFAAAAK